MSDTQAQPATPATTPAPDPILRRPSRSISITHGRFEMAEFKRTVWQARPEAGHTLEQVTAPSYWQQCANRLRIGDRIEILSDDMNLLAELIVVRVLPGQAIVRPLWSFITSEEDQQEFEEAEEGLGLDEYAIRFGGSSKWRVLLRATKKELKSGFADRKEAQTWLRNYIRELKK